MAGIFQVAVQKHLIYDVCIHICGLGCTCYYERTQSAVSGTFVLTGVFVDETRMQPGPALFCLWDPFRSYDEELFS